MVYGTGNSPSAHDRTDTADPAVVKALIAAGIDISTLEIKSSGDYEISGPDGAGWISFGSEPSGDVHVWIGTVYDIDGEPHGNLEGPTLDRLAEQIKRWM